MNGHLGWLPAAGYMLHCACIPNVYPCSRSFGYFISFFDVDIKKCVLIHLRMPMPAEVERKEKLLNVADKMVPKFGPSPA